MNRRCGRTYHFQLQGRKSVGQETSVVAGGKARLILGHENGMVRSSEMSVHIRTTWRYIIEDGDFHDCRCENLKSYKNVDSFSKKNEETLTLLLQEWSRVRVNVLPPYEQHCGKMSRAITYKQPFYCVFLDCASFLAVINGTALLRSCLLSSGATAFSCEGEGEDQNSEDERLLAILEWHEWHQDKTHHSS
jgi:hypothetical protein